MISSSIKNRYVILCTYVVHNNTYIRHSSRTYGKIIFRASRQIHKYVMLWDDPFIVLEAQHLQIKNRGLGVFFPDVWWDGIFYINLLLRHICMWHDIMRVWFFLNSSENRWCGAHRLYSIWKSNSKFYWKRWNIFCWKRWKPSLINCDCL